MGQVMSAPERVKTEFLRTRDEPWPAPDSPHTNRSRVTGPTARRMVQAQGYEAVGHEATLPQADRHGKLVRVSEA